MPYYEAAESSTPSVTTTKIGTTLTGSFTAPTKSVSAVVKSDTVTFELTLVDAGGVALLGKTIDLYIGVSPTKDSSVVTGAGGKAIFTKTVPATVEVDKAYNFTFAGDAVYSSSGRTIYVTIESRVPNLVLTVPATAVAGGTITWSGVMSDPKVAGYKISDKSIYLDQMLAGGTWTIGVDGPQVTGSTGTYSDTYVVPTFVGTYYYRTRFTGGSKPHHEATESNITVMEVKTELSSWDKLKNKWNALPVWGKGLIIVAPIGAIVLATRKKKK